MRTITSAVVALLATTRVVYAATTTSATASTGVEKPSAAPTLNSPSVQGCFSSSGELTFNSTQIYNSIGKCATEICHAAGYYVGGTTGGSDCWCGNKYPPSDKLANDTDCNIGCTGYPQEACGGLNFWTIYNTGVKLAVESSNDDTSSSSSSAATGVVATTSTNAAGVATTVIYTATAAAETTSSSSSGGGSNTVGIAVGVVVAIVAVAGIAGAVWFVMRRKRNAELEEEHRRNAAVNSFINGKPPSSSGGMSMSDARLDPVMAHRRMSDGSIADNQDYSRRILRVTNA